MRLAVNTGGGDAPGLNAVIRAITLGACARGWEVLGIRRGYDGLLSGDADGIVRLDERSVLGITNLGGTILGTTNRGNPLRWHDGRDRGGEIVTRLGELGCDGLIAIGGDGSLGIAAELGARGLNVIGVPKTIDNDLAATTMTFGFHTAVQTATDAIGRLHSTAESHRRVMVVEVMGRDAGWIALFAGLGGAAHVILIPEIPWNFERVCEAIEGCYVGDAGYAVVVVAEGARPEGGEVHVTEINTHGRPRYGGIAEHLAAEITACTGHESRSLVLGHLQRGGEPTAYDKVLALRFGAAAVELAARGDWGCMVALDPPEIHAVPIAAAIAKLKLVPLDSDVVHTARSLGISFGE
ncbi:MAG: ATP-dependent 6-phosphofructokinase [Longimicrobiales bacterium]|nr:ATP-dependent 6-phosphofructokinase [Longimicrobiales bacterium]